MAISNSQAVSDFRRRRKANLIKVCGNKCNLCGYDKTISALEFHHIHPENKEYGIASNGTCHNIQKDLNEVKKCILVCANCHREIHEDFYTEEFLENNQIYDEYFANSLIEERESVKNYCKKCGKEITRTATYCIECAHEEARTCKNRPNREELKELIQKHTFAELGRMYGVSDNSIKKWCKAVNLPSRKKDIVLITDWSNI